MKAARACGRVLGAGGGRQGRCAGAKWIPNTFTGGEGFTAENASVGFNFFLSHLILLFRWVVG